MSSCFRDMENKFLHAKWASEDTFFSRSLRENNFEKDYTWPIKVFNASATARPPQALQLLLWHDGHGGENGN